MADREEGAAGSPRPILRTSGEPWDKGEATATVQGDDPGPQVIPGESLMRLGLKQEVVCSGQLPCWCSEDACPSPSQRLRVAHGWGGPSAGGR